jgi:RimJ/RimL family protein N-acetyltransferase
MKRELATPRLLLRPLRAEDAEPVFRLFANWEVIRWLSAPPWPYTLADAAGFIERSRRDDRVDAAELAIVRDGEPIGGIGIRVWPARELQSGPGPYVGYWLGQPYWGNGYMTEACAALAAAIFADGAHDTIYSGVFAGNGASLRVQEKLGFVEDGRVLLHARPHAADLPHINTRLTRAAFETRTP